LNYAGQCLTNGYESELLTESFKGLEYILKMRFDWEPRPTPEGLLQIHRNQKREASDQSLRDYTSQSTSQKSRSQWEESSQRKAQLVAQTLEQHESSVFQATTISSSSSEAEPRPRNNPPVHVVLQRDEEEKKARRAAEKEVAARRREVLIQQAEAIAAEREKLREAQAQENRLKLLKEELVAEAIIACKMLR
jgi:hypothetical protein